MKLFKNRIFAILLTVVVAVLATLLGVYRTANRMTHQVEAMFYDGVYLKNEGYTQPGIDSHLNNASNAALGFATIAVNYPELSEKSENLVLARRELLAVVGVGDKSAAAVRMWDRFSDIVDAMSNDLPDGDMSGRDMAAMTQYFNTFVGAYNAISVSVYNDKVTEYLDGRSFLARAFGALVSAREPDRFYSPAQTAILFSPAEPNSP